MASWIQEALELLEQWNIGSNTSLSSKVCHEQSNILRGALVHVRGFLEQVQDVALNLGGDNKRSFVLIGEDVKCMIHVSSRLVTSYEKENWVITALLSEESREDFKDAFVELYDSIELASGFMLEAAGSERDKSKIRDAYSSCLMRKISVSMLELAAVNDRKQMMRVGLSSGDNDEGSSVLQLLCTMLLEKNAPLLDRSHLQFKQHLKQGGFGTVYEACWLNNVDVAVKVFSSGDSSFRRELAALASCKHPNMLRIFGYCYDSEKQQHSLVMERMDMDLGDLLAKSPGISALDSITILLEIAKGMAWLHSKDVIHRDLKPQNILIASSKHIMDVRIADFGISRTGFATSRVSFATSKLGTRIYMAPEVWNSQHYSKKSDVFSFAMICYQMLTGRLPFEGEVLESSDYMLRVCNGMRPVDSFPDSCPVELAELTRRCWSGEAMERPSFSEVCEALKQMKIKLVTSVENWSDVRKKLLASGSSGTSPGSFSQNHSRTRVDTDSLFRRNRPSNTSSSDSGSAGRTSAPAAPPPSQPATYPPATQPTRPPSKKDELLKLVQKGRMTEAFQQALSLKDPDTVWWLASKVDSSLMQTFDERMVYSVAEQLVEVMSSDAHGVCDWLNTAVNLLISSKIKYNSARLHRLVARIAQGLHGLIAITPRDSELAEFLRTTLRDCNKVLQMVEVQIRIYGAA